MAEIQEGRAPVAWVAQARSDFGRNGWEGRLRKALPCIRIRLDRFEITNDYALNEIFQPEDSRVLQLAVSQIAVIGFIL